jgi:hypothetical protein
LFKFKRVSLLVAFVYLAYLAKSAMGINISKQYSIPNVFKVPLKAIEHQIPGKDKKKAKIYRHAGTKPVKSPVRHRRTFKNINRA